MAIVASNHSSFCLPWSQGRWPRLPFVSPSLALRYLMGTSCTLSLALDVRFSYRFWSSDPFGALGRWDTKFSTFSRLTTPICRPLEDALAP